MATIRLYPLYLQGSLASNVLKGNWTVGSNTPELMSLVKSDQTANWGVPQFTFGSGVVQDGINQRKFVYSFPTDGYLSGTINVCLPAYANHAPEQDAHFRIHAWISEGTTSTLRGTVLDNYTEPAGVTNRWTLTQQAMQLITPQAVTPVGYFAGDYLHVEVGYVLYVAPADNSCYTAFGTKNASGTILPDYVAGDAAYGPGTNLLGASWVDVTANEVAPEIAQSFGPLVWVEWEGSDDTIRVWAPVDLPDPSTYYHGYKAPKLLSAGRVVRALSDEQGEYQGQTFEITVQDTDRDLRTLLGLSDGRRHLLNTRMVMRMISQADWRARRVPRTVAIGQVRNYRLH